MKFCPVVPEICCGHVHVAKKERRIIIRNGGDIVVKSVVQYTKIYIFVDIYI
jgi:hypothetical protein